MKRMMCAAALVACLPTIGAAVPVHWDVYGMLFSGRTVFDPSTGFSSFMSSGVADVEVSGSFTFDADTQTFSDVNVMVGDDDVMTTPLGGFFAYTPFAGGATFGLGNGAAAGSGGERVLYFNAPEPLTNDGGTVSSSVTFSFPGVSLLALGGVTLEGTPTQAEMPTVPLPASGLALLMGLLGLGALRRRA